MVAVVIILAVILTVSLAALALSLLARRDFELRADFWRGEFLGHNLGLHSWAFVNYDLVPEWESTRSHIQGMDRDRRYAEWVTICGNHETRRELEVAIKGE